MPPTLTTPARPAAPNESQPAAVVVERRRFATATYPHSEIADQRTHTLAAGAQTPQPVDIPAFGYLRAVWLEVVVTATNAGGATTVAMEEDAPWNIFDEIQLQDVSTQALVQLGGYNAYLMHKYGGYGNAEDPTLDGFYSAPVTGTGATGGSFSFAIRIPTEIVPRDGFGSLLNQSQQQPFRLKYTLAALSSIYSTAPNGDVDVALTVIPEFWAIPPESIGGVQNQVAPDGHGTTQFWTQHFQSVATTGQQVVRLPKVGGMIRNHVFVCRNASGVRTTSIFPATFEYRWEGRPLLNETRNNLIRRMRRQYGLTLDAGVLVFPYTDEMDGKPGGELRDRYLPTNGSTRLEVSGVWTTGSVDQVVNDVYAGRRG